MVLPIKGEPPCRLQFDPKNRILTLVTLYEAPEPDVARLKNVKFNAFVSGDEDLAELVVQVEGNVRGAYGLLAGIADELQVEKLPLAAAVATGVARHRNILAGRGALTTEQEVGLFGELLFLEFLIHAIGPGPAVSAWQGPAAEEHDFTLASAHIEVKTTTSERRRHVINGLEQLVPLRDVPLSLLSIQLTRSSPDGGRSLPQIVAEVRTLAGGHQVIVNAMLDTFGWQAEDADLYSTHWAVRSIPRAYSVNHEFPAMTPDLIGPVVPNFALLSDVSYKVDLTNLDFDTLPKPIAGFVELKENRLT
ncbi:Putative PD-(D/E)XK family member [Glycomyces harbinensis]|uniref:Putative PD-(D/E)XK family member n=2 Tax=Glycomyces harbinensis TaxID=58114 RepID=A0A1G7DV78_9ACTN|nr:PD-(D/E)XK motif protein [Glycomyces harbinensis]SDE55348.1 Putative PD-(D/E)XK family member [Glycomyces harbinensis]